MDNIFNEIDLKNLQTKEQVNNINYQQISDLSDFPIEIDNIKTINFNSNSSDAILEKFNEYYELINSYLANPTSFNKMDELKSVISYVQDYVLSSSDYSILRDSLLELSNYLKQITHEEIYNTDNGVYNKIAKSSEDFNNNLNQIINDINSKYSNLEDDPLGKIIPLNSINKNYLSEELKKDFNYIELTEGIYIDRTAEENISIPANLQTKPIVLKVKNNVAS